MSKNESLNNIWCAKKKSKGEIIILRYHVGDWERGEKISRKYLFVNSIFFVKNNF
jgi:hypothetical protein